MGILQRSKSAAVVEEKTDRKPPQTAGPRVSGEEAKKSQERPRTADPKRSFSRPRTANAAIERTGTEIEVPCYSIEIKAGSEIFRFPTPASGLQPPKSAGIATSTTSLNSQGSAAIGVALGSPSQARPYYGRSYTADHASKRIPVPSQPQREPPAVPEHPDLDMFMPELRKKKSNWKSFAGLFGRKPAKPVVEEPFYKLKRLHEDEDEVFTPEQAQTATRDGLSPGPYELPVVRSPLPAAHGQKQTHSKTRGPPTTIQKAGFSPMFASFQYVSEDKSQDDYSDRRDSPLSLDEKPEVLTVNRTPRLDLDFPEPKFERYSIMFEKILEDSKNRPSILERRQSKLNRNRSVKKLDLDSEAIEVKKPTHLEVIAVPQRSVSSPNLKRSPSVRIVKKLLSPVGEVFSSVHRPRPIQRSKTAPPSATSPATQAFPKPTITVQSHSPISEVHTEIEITSLPPTPHTATFSEIDSPAIISTAVEHNVAQREPSWSMMAGPDPTLQVKPLDLKKKKSAAQIDMTKLSSVEEASEQTDQPVTTSSKQPMKPRVIQLGKNRTSTPVLIETMAE